LEEYRFTVCHELAGKRLDVFLAESFEHKLSRSFIKKLIDKGAVTVNQKTPKAHQIVNEKDEVFLEVPDPEPVEVVPEDIPVNIVYEDSDLVVVNKQSGMVVHPAPGHYRGTLVNALIFHCKELSGIGGVLRPGIVHRLDKDTTGLIVVAKNDSTHKHLCVQFKNKDARRIYIVLVKGVVELDNGIINMPIGRHPMDRKRMGITLTNSREAVTRYSVLERFKDFSVLEVSLGTGRTHQIRVHMAHIGYPVLGDKTYGIKKGLSRQALHAKKLYFKHPGTGKEMEFETEIPNDMAEVIRRGTI